jgi:lipopolysaccharide transport system ATP-binding protein
MIQAMTPRRQKPTVEYFWALRNVSFKVEKGQTVGLIGPNGSGKSTALKLMAGIIHPTEGQIVINGRVSALLELGSGMHPDLTGRENIFLNGSLLGIDNAEMHRLYDDIVRFAELQRFIDTPVKHYSSGMYMRLGFSVAIHVKPDILLVDEVLAVGDQSFQIKCLERIYDLKKKGATIVVVSHGLESLRGMCSELIWLHNGEVQSEGPADSVMDDYLVRVHHIDEAKREYERQNQAIHESKRVGSGQIEILNVRFLNEAGEKIRSLMTRDPLTVEIEYEAYEPVENPVFGLALHHADGTHINGPNTKQNGLTLGTVNGRGIVRYFVEELPLLPGGYELTVAAYDESISQPFDVHVRAYPLRVNAGGTTENHGLFYIPAEWEHQPAQTAVNASPNGRRPA